MPVIPNCKGYYSHYDHSQSCPAVRQIVQDSSRRSSRQIIGYLQCLSTNILKLSRREGTSSQEAGKLHLDYTWEPELTGHSTCRPASQNKPTTSEQLQLDSEMDGTAFGEEKEEAKRQKDESWARYTDANPKGAGNTMNRG